MVQHRLLETPICFQVKHLCFKNDLHSTNRHCGVSTYGKCTIHDNCWTRKCTYCDKDDHILEKDLPDIVVNILNKPKPSNKPIEQVKPKISPFGVDKIF